MNEGQTVYIKATVLKVHGPHKVKVQIAKTGGILTGTLTTAAAATTSAASDQETTPILDFQETTPILG